MKIGFLPFIFLAAALSAEPRVDITKVAGKDKETVDTVLGSPDSSSTSKYGKKYHYEKGDTEIVFINGLADWITIYDMDDITFSPKALEELGLSVKSPTFKNDYSMRWSGISDLLEVSIFKGTNKCDYAYIKTKTK